MLRAYDVGGRVVLVRPALDAMQAGESAEDWFARMLEITEAAVPWLTGQPYVDVNEDDLPELRTRDAWRLVDGAIVVDSDALAEIEAQRSIPSQGEKLAEALNAASAAHPEFSDLFDTLGVILTEQPRP